MIKIRNPFRRHHYGKRVDISDLLPPPDRDDVMTEMMDSVLERSGGKTFCLDADFGVTLYVGDKFDVTFQGEDGRETTVHCVMTKWKKAVGVEDDKTPVLHLRRE